jgi:multiple sugar transport system permease protein
MRNQPRRGWHRWVNGPNICAVIVAIVVAAPLYWLLTSSFKTPTDIVNPSPSALPRTWTFSNYTTAFGQYHFGTYFANSLIVAIGTTVIVLLLGIPAAYAMGKLRMTGKFTVLVILLIISVFPVIAVIEPLFLILRTLGWLNSYQALIVPYVAFNLPFTIWILRNYILGVPYEMIEAAHIDGASQLRTLVTVVVPTMLPGLFTAAVFCFTACWTEFMMALTFNSSNSFRTIPVGISLFGTEFTLPYGPIFAGSVVAIVPIVIIVLIFKRNVISGLTAGAIK